MNSTEAAAKFAAVPLAKLGGSDLVVVVVVVVVVVLVVVVVVVVVVVDGWWSRFLKSLFLKWSWYMDDDDVDGKSGMGNPRVLCANYLLNE